MDGKYFIPGSIILPKKCRWIFDGICEWPDENREIGVDRISELPDEIVLVILSFLSLREAVTTSVLSRRWSDLWKHITNLKFNTGLLKINHGYPQMHRLGSWNAERCKYIEMVNSVLQSHKASSLKKFQISLYVNKTAHCTVTKWLEFVFSRQVERLELDFLCYEAMYMVSLEELLRDCNPQNFIAFKSLKRLCLRDLKVSGEAIDFCLRNCPLLKKLVIHSSILTSDVMVRGTTLMLKHLDIYYCSGKISIVVSAPNLTWLRVSTERNKLILENVPKLIRADYTCTSGSPNDVKDLASTIFCCFSRLKVLSLTLFYPKVFLANGFPRMPKLKKLVVEYYGVYEHGLLPVTALIWASPRLQEFNLEFSLMPRDLTAWKEGLANAERHPHRHLKVLKFTGFCGEDGGHVELVTYILANCVALEKIIIGCSLLFPSSTCSTIAAARDYAKQQLHGKVPHHIQLCFA